MKTPNTSLVKSLPALLTLTGGMLLGGAKSASAAVSPEVNPQQPLDVKIKNLSEQMNSTPSTMAMEPGQANTNGIRTLYWGNWGNGGFGPGMWHNWRNGGWGNGGWRNGGWGNGGWHNWRNF